MHQNSAIWQKFWLALKCSHKHNPVWICKCLLQTLQTWQAKLLQLLLGVNFQTVYKVITCGDHYSIYLGTFNFYYTFESYNKFRIIL